MTIPRLAGQDAVLNTGQGTALQRIIVPVVVSPAGTAAGVRFDIAFGTDEQVLPGQFLDSLTITLRTVDRSLAVTLLTADRFGESWLDQAGGFVNPDRDLYRAPIPPSPALASFSARAQHAVLIQLRGPLLEQPTELVFSLFDNEDGEASRAVLSSLQIQPGDPALLALESSASPAGPFAREDAARFDPLFLTVTVPRGGGRGFFRLEGDTASSFTQLSVQQGVLLFDYDKAVGQPTLFVEGADSPAGPFQPVNNAVIDLNARRAFIPLLNAPAFLRLAGSHPVRVTHDEVSGEQRILDFEVAPVPPRLWSSSAVQGPYAAETGVVVDGLARRLRLPLGGMARFYRIAADVPWRFTEISPTPNNLLIRYAVP